MYQEPGNRTGNEPRVSVCIPTYNAAKTIERCLESILSQTVKPLEILVVDGYSEDETLKILKEYPDVKVVGFARGIGKARKILVNHASGDIIAWVDADVVVSPNWLELHLKFHREEKVMILSGRRSASRSITPNESVHEWLRISQMACTMKKEVFSVVNYDERFKRGEEWDLLVSAHRKSIPSHYWNGFRVSHIPRPRKRKLREMVYAGNYVLFLKKYGLWYIKFDPKHFLAFIFRIGLIYAVPICLIIGLIFAVPLSLIFPLALLIYPVAWCAYFINAKRKDWGAGIRGITFKMLEEIMKGVGEHLHVFKVL